MENKNFIINESERERILRKHQDATKNLYLNIISEQNNKTVEYKIKSDSYSLANSENKKRAKLKLFKGTTFKKGPNETRLVADTKYHQYVGPSWGEVRNSPNNGEIKLKGLENTTYRGKISYLCDEGRFYVNDDKNIKYYDENQQLSKQLRILCRTKNTDNKSSGTQTKTTGSIGTSKQGLVKPSDEVITKLINMVK
jgi:hypothetical protein